MVHLCLSVFLSVSLTVAMRATPVEGPRYTFARQLFVDPLKGTPLSVCLSAVCLSGSVNVVTRTTLAGKYTSACLSVTQLAVGGLCVCVSVCPSVWM